MGPLAVVLAVTAGFATTDDSRLQYVPIIPTGKTSCQVDAPDEGSPLDTVCCEDAEAQDEGSVVMSICDTFFKDKPKVILNRGEEHDEVTYHIGLVVGHNSRHRGAVNYLGESEYDFNSRIALKLQVRLKDMGINAAVIYRPPRGGYDHEVKSVMDQLEALGITTSIHLHFNSAEDGVDAVGAEILILEGANIPSSLVVNLSEVMLNDLDLRMGITSRGIKGIHQGHNGSGMLHEAMTRDMRAMIVEPTFAHYRHTESIQVFENEDLYVETLAGSINELAEYL